MVGVRAVFFPTGCARQTSDRQHQPAWVPLDHRDSTVLRIKALCGNMGSGTIKGLEKGKDDNEKHYQLPYDINPCIYIYIDGEGYIYIYE